MTLPPDNDIVGRLAEEWRERLRRGEHPEVSEYTDKYPEHADEIRDLFPAIAMMEELKPSSGDVSSASGPGSPVAGGRTLERLGDFRILREVGRGGMGVVYEAEQESLGRRVALKILPSQALLDPDKKKRFQREAKATARLHHTNIVPVYGVGEHDGMQYYVMQFIQGLGLDEVLAELRHLRQAKNPSRATPATVSRRQPAIGGKDVSAAEMARSLLTGPFAPTALWGESAEEKFRATPPSQPAGAGGSVVGTESFKPRLATSSARVADPSSGTVSTSEVHLPGQAGQTTLSDTGRHYWHSVVRIGMQVAEALEYANGQGVIHRDIKPSNLLLDTQGTVWVTDFGLAKATADGDNLTHTGDIVGTLRYMAPERFRGQADARGDIYSLGLTLYELLVHRPAFDEKDRSKLIHRVTHEEPVPPRKINPAIPRDLETIVLKTIEREPARRYQTAGALREDLKRFLEDKPIRARRVGVLERSWRWCRRNPLVAGLTAGIVALSILAVLASTYAAFHFERLAGRESEARAQAEADRKKAEAARADAEAARKREADQRRRAVGARNTALASQKREAEQRRRAVRARNSAQVSQKREAEQRKLAQENFAKARQILDKYLTMVSESRLLNVPGMQPLRKELLESALKQYQGFLVQQGKDPSLQRDLARAYARMGRITADIGSRSEALKCYDKSFALLNALPKTKELQLDLAAHHQAVGNLQRQLGDRGEARKSCAKAYTLLLAVSPQVPTRVGTVQGATGTITSGIRVHSSDDIDILKRFVSVLNDLGTAHVQAGEPGIGLSRYNEALYIQKEMVRKYPKHAEIVLFKHGLANQWSRLGDLQGQVGLTAEALAYHREAQTILKALLHDYPRHLLLADFRRDLAASQEGTGALQARADRLKDALDSYQEALPTRQRLARENPAVSDYHSDLAHCHFRIGMLQARLSRQGSGRDARLERAAQDSFRQAIDLQQQLIETAGPVKQYVRGLSVQHANLARLQRQMGKPQDALASFREARGLLEELPPARAGDWYNLALARAGCSSVVGRGEPDAKLTAKELEERKQEAGLALEALQKAVRAGFNDIQRLEKSTEFAPLRARAEFKALEEEVRKKSKVLSWVHDFEAAKALAAKEKRDLFIWFGASDWAAVDMVFRKTHLSKGAFFDYASKHFVMVDLDTPKYKLKPKNFAATQELQKRWNVSRFPTLVLADALGRRYGVILGASNNELLANYIGRVERVRQVRVQRDQYLGKAAASRGIEKAKWLDQALSVVPSAFIGDHIEIAQQIFTLDSADRAGMRTKYIPHIINARSSAALALGRMKKDWKGTVRQLNSALDTLRPPESSRFLALTMRGYAHGEIGSLDLAAADYGRAVRSQPQSGAMWYNEAIALLAAGREEEYRRLCARMLDRLGQVKQNHTWLIQTWSLLPQAGPNWSRVMALADQLPWPAESGLQAGHYGRALYRAGRFQDAVRRLEQSIPPPEQRTTSSTLGAYLPMNMAALAMAHHRLGNSVQARRWLAKMNEQAAQRDFSLAWDNSSPFTNWNLWYNRAVDELFRFEAKALIEGSPVRASRQVRIAFARAHAHLGQWDKALADYNQAVALLPDNPGLRLERARCYLQLGRRGDAAADNARAAELLTKTVSEQRRAVENAPTDLEPRERLSETYRQLALVQRRLGRTGEAATTLRALQELWPEDPSRLAQIAEQLAELWAPVGKDKTGSPAGDRTRSRLADQAAHVLRQALAVGLDNPERIFKEPQWDFLRDRADFRALQTEALTRSRLPLPRGEIRSLSSPTSRGAVMTVAVSPNGLRAVSGSYDNKVHLWDLVTGKEIRRLEDLDGPVYAVDFSPDGHSALIAGNEKSIRLWDVDTGKIIHRLAGHTAWVGAVKYLPDGRRALSGGSDGTLCLWNLKTGKEIRHFKATVRAIRSLALTPAGRQALCCGDDGRLRLWDLESGKEIRNWAGHRAGIYSIWSVAVSADGRRALSAGNDGMVILWDLKTGKEIRSWPSSQLLRDVSYARDGRRFLVSDGQYLILRDAESGVELARFFRPTSTSRVVFTPDGQHALTADNDGKVRLWFLSEEIARASGFVQRGNLDGAIAVYGKLIAAGSGDRGRPDLSPVHRIARARLLGRKGRWVEAAADYEKAFESSGVFGTSEVWAERGRCQAMAGQWGKAARAFVKAMDLIAQKPGWNTERRRLAEELAQWEPALEQALKHAPEGLWLHLAAGGHYAERGQSRKADEAFTRAAALTGKELNRFLEAGWWVVGPFPEYLQPGETPFSPENKAPALSRPVAASGSATPLHWQHASADEYGRVNLRTIFNADHISAYALTYIYSPEERPALLLVGGGDNLQLWLNGRLVHENTFVFWHFGLDRVPVMLRAGRNTLLARVKNHSGDHSLNIRVADNPMDRALTAAQFGHWEKAAGLLAKHFARHKPAEEGDWALWKFYARLLLLSGNAEGARHHLAVLSTRFGRTADGNLACHLLNTLNYASSPEPKTEIIERLIPLAEKSATTFPREKGWRMFEVAFARYRTGQFEEAIREMKKAVDVDNYPNAWLVLAMAHHRLGHKADARRWLARADQWYAKVTKALLASEHFVLPRGWVYWGEFLIIYREAKALIRSDTEPEPKRKAIEARARALQRKLDKATAPFDETLLLQPEQPRLWLARGRRLAELKQWKKAAADFARAIRLQPTNPQIVREPGRIYADLGETDQAVAAFTKAIANILSGETRQPKQPSPRSAADLVPDTATPTELTLWDKAFAQAAEEHPKDGLFQIAAGRHFAWRGQSKRAEAAYSRAAALLSKEQNRFIEAGWWVAGPYPEDLKTSCPPEKDSDPSRPAAGSSSEGNLTYPARTWRSVATGDNGRVDFGALFNADHISGYALTYVYSTDERTATLLVGGDDLVRVWLNGRPVHEITQYPLVEWPYGLHGVPVTFRAGRNTLLAKVTNHIGPHFLWLRIADNPFDQAALRADMGLWDDAATLFARGLDRQPSVDSILYRHCALAHLLVGDKAGYRRYLDRMFAPYHASGAGHPFELAYTGSHLQGAIKGALLVDLAEKNLTVSRRAWDCLCAGLAHYRAVRFERAIERLQEGLKADPNWPSHSSTWLALALAHHRLGHAKEAREWFDMAEKWYIKAAKDARASATGRATLLFWMDWPTVPILRREAWKLIRGTAPKDDPSLKALVDRTRDWLKKREKATRDYDVALLLQPDQARLWLARGRRHAELKRWRQAEADLTRATELAPEDHSGWYLAAPVRLYQEDVPGYRRACREMLTRFGKTDDPEIAARIVESCLLAPDAVKDLKVVGKLAERATTGTEKHPQYRRFLLARGLADYRAGQFARALPWLQKSVGARDPFCDVTANLVLALAHHRLEQAGEARQALDKADGIIKARFPKIEKEGPGADWDDWLRFQVLRREAGALIEGKK
jgi:serine/threonine-protein kinase